MFVLSLLFVAFVQGASADYGIGGHLGHLGLSHVRHVPYLGPVPHHNPVPVVHHVSVPYAHGFDYGHHHDDTEGVILTCTGKGGPGNTFAINIKNKKSSPWFTKMGLDKQYGPGLEATINVDGTPGVEWSVVLTELYNRYCVVHDLGHLMEPKASLGYGAYSDSHPGHNYGFDGEHAHPIPGVLTTFENNKKHSINIDRLYGFKSLSELAGRGVVLCAKEQVKSDGHGHYECVPDINGDEYALACCSLEYADTEQFLS